MYVYDGGHNKYLSASAEDGEKNKCITWKRLAIFRLNEVCDTLLLNWLTNSSSDHGKRIRVKGFSGKRKESPVRRFLLGHLLYLSSSLLSNGASRRDSVNYINAI